MTVKSERFYWVECDRAACKEALHHEQSALEALISAEGNDWMRIDGKWYCPEHRAAELNELKTWCGFPNEPKDTE